MTSMLVSIANYHLACSTLMLGRFFAMNDVPLKEFKQAIEDAIIVAESRETKGYWNLEETQILQNYAAKDFAFVTASTDQHQIGVERCLKDMGFMHTKRVKKRKNSTKDCVFWMIEAPDFFKSLEDTEQVGTPPEKYTRIR